MKHLSLREKYGSYFKELSQYAKAAARIDETNVYQEMNPKTRKLMDFVTQDNLLPSSHLGNEEHFKAFLQAVKDGRRGLILMEHYTNLDLPQLCYLLEQAGDWGRDLSGRIVAIAGMKLNEEDPFVRAYAEAFTRVVIYPTRSLEKAECNATSAEEAAAEEARARRINLAAMHAMDNCKRQGKVILVFPSGTRYRPGKPETKRGLREIDSYLRMFDVMILVTVNGQAITIDMEHPDDMLADLSTPDKIVLTASPVLECRQFRKDVLSSLPADEPDPKQRVIDKVMEYFDCQHEEAEKTRLP